MLKRFRRKFAVALFGVVVLGLGALSSGCHLTSLRIGPRGVGVSIGVGGPGGHFGARRGPRSPVVHVVHHVHR